jgi:glutamate racemase
VNTATKVCSYILVKQAFVPAFILQTIFQIMNPIGIFDSGYGGLTVFKSIQARLPQYDYLYLGDNARAPYGPRSFETVYQYTLQCVQWFFKQGCPLVILACNTASAKALRSIQQNDLPTLAPNNRVLGVIRPTAEVIGQLTHTQKVGILATAGTVKSGSYSIEIAKFSPAVQVAQQACPMWVPLIENGQHLTPGADYFIKKDIDELVQRQPTTDIILLACTHYPLIQESISRFLPPHITLLSQGHIVAASLQDYLLRHPEMETRLTKNGTMQFFTTDDADGFEEKAALFFGQPVQAQQVHL